jgi:hypothetical protein
MEDVDPEHWIADTETHPAQVARLSGSVKFRCVVPSGSCLGGVGVLPFFSRPSRCRLRKSEIVRKSGGSPADHHEVRPLHRRPSDPPGQIEAARVRGASVASQILIDPKNRVFQQNPPFTDLDTSIERRGG